MKLRSFRRAEQKENNHPPVQYTGQKFKSNGKRGKTIKGLSRMCRQPNGPMSRKHRLIALFRSLTLLTALGVSLCILASARLSNSPIDLSFPTALYLGQVSLDIRFPPQPILG
jgi:hypothetical protein